MGNASWDADTYTRTSVDYKKKSRSELFKNTISKDFDPRLISIRESRDSEINPESTAIIIALDVTGSMGMIPEYLAKEGLGLLMNDLYEQQPVTNPHIMMMGIGDAYYDREPLQATQFEADIRIAEQLVNLYLEGGGGGNGFESYDLAWLFAAEKTDIDCWNKRKKKGYLFTIGDERAPSKLTKPQIEKLGFKYESDVTSTVILQAASQRYNVFHIIVEEGLYARRYRKEVISSWQEVLNKKVILLDNYQHLSEVINYVIRINEGENIENIFNYYSDTSQQRSVFHAVSLINNVI